MLTGGSVSRWRSFLLILCAVGIALIAENLYVGSTGRMAQYGFTLVSAGEPYLQRVMLIAPGSAAARAGLRAGDVLDTRSMSAQDRYRLYNPKYRGEAVRVNVVRRTGLWPRTLTSTPYNLFTWDVWFGFAGGMWMLLFAAILAIRRPESRDARLLALLLIGFNLQQVLTPSDWITAWPMLDAFAAVASWLSQIALVLLVTYSFSFARPPSRTRKALAWVSYAVAGGTSALGIAGVIAECTEVLDPAGPVFAGPLGVFALYSLPYVFPLLCGTATWVETRGLERTKFLWAFIPLAVFYAVGFLNHMSAFYPQFGQPFNAVFNLAIFLAPLGLTYSLLNRRLLDIGFALNRAAVFSGVSLVLVGAFVLVEWALGEWMNGIGHEANIAISGALALALGLSMRFVHGKVEHFVDNIMFRKRREDEEAIRRMAREAPYITDRSTLLERVERTLTRHADASSVAVLIDDASGHYGPIDENDPAIVSLRAEHVPADLHLFETSIRGEWAYPMVARGRLVGALVLGPKNSQESYAPDESAAIAQLANSVAGALDVLAIQAPDDTLDAVLASLDAVNAAITKLPKAIARELRDPSALDA